MQSKLLDSSVMCERDILGILTPSYPILCYASIHYYCNISTKYVIYVLQISTKYKRSDMILVGLGAAYFSAD